METCPFLKGLGRPKSVFFKTPIQSRSKQSNQAFPDYLENKVIAHQLIHLWKVGLPWGAILLAFFSSF